MGKAERQTKRAERKTARAVKKGKDSVYVPMSSVSEPLQTYIKKQNVKELNKPLKTYGAVVGGVAIATATALTGAGIPMIIGAGLLGTTGTSIFLQSKSVRKAVVNLPARASEYGTAIAEKIEGSTKIQENIEKSKSLTGLGLALGGVGLGIIGTSAVGLIKDKAGELPVSTGNNGVIGTSPIGSSVILPQTQSITAKKTSYKRRRRTKSPSVRQSVRINIINKPSNVGIKVNNKKYLNERVF